MHTHGASFDINHQNRIMVRTVKNSQNNVEMDLENWEGWYELAR